MQFVSVSEKLQEKHFVTIQDIKSWRHRSPPYRIAQSLTYDFMQGLFLKSDHSAPFPITRGEQLPPVIHAPVFRIVEPNKSNFKPHACDFFVSEGAPYFGQLTLCSIWGSCLALVDAPAKYWNKNSSRCLAAARRFTQFESSAFLPIPGSPTRTFRANGVGAH